MIKKILLGLLVTYFIAGSGSLGCASKQIKNQEQEEIGRTSETQTYEIAKEIANKIEADTIKADTARYINASKNKPFDLTERIREERKKRYTKEFALRRIKELEEQKNRSNYNKAGFYENVLKVFKFKLTDSEKVNLLEKLLNHYEKALLEGDTMKTRDVLYDGGYVEEEVSVAPEIRKRIKEIKSELGEIKSYNKEDKDKQ